ncbi:transcription factor MYB98-like [Cucurbita moschata]|uniref:Transcription factor MYB98-like n=1 Tax=Cucurbita moschata TaxID=3662 RepID=A0A6J1ELF0_CUCMO|nr:transcription factor MYB98-like [Cucurbita moschata]
MEVESNLTENLSSNQACKEDELSFQFLASKGNYLHEFHHLDSSSNPILEDENMCSLDHFNPYSYGCSSNNSNTAVEDLYELNKACADQNGGCGQVMDNFQSSGDYYNFHQMNQIDVMGLERNSIPLDFPDVKPVNFFVPDEVSCITSGNGHFQKATMNKNVNFSSLLRTSKGQKKPNVIKGQWTVEEDRFDICVEKNRVLVQLVEQYGTRKWSHIAQTLPGRIGKQCRERWHNHLRPDIKKDTWSEEEDRVLIEAHAEIGNKWAEIAKRLPGRTENSIKNHWNATKRRQYSKRKCRSKYPRCSLLQDYIKSLDSNTTRHQKKICPNDTKSKSKLADRHHRQPQTANFCPNDWTVPNSDLKDEAEFYLDDNFFREGCSIDTLMENIAAASADDANNYERKRYHGNEELVEFHQRSNVEMEKLQNCAPVKTAAAMEFEVTKELDLVEMMSQVNEVNKMR